MIWTWDSHPWICYHCDQIVKKIRETQIDEKKKRFDEEEEEEFFGCKIKRNAWEKVHNTYICY